MAVVPPALNQQQAPIYQHAQVAPAYRLVPITLAYQQTRVQAPHHQMAPNQNRNQRNKVTFNPIPMTYSELYPSFLQKVLVVPRPLAPLSEPCPLCYNPNAHSIFHEGASGNDLESCYALKKKVQDLIQSKVLTFRDVGPNLKNNPLPTHGTSIVNVIDKVS